MKTQIFSLIACLFLFIGCSKPTEAPETAAAPAFDEAQELAAIMATIENETKCFYARDYECWKKNYAQWEYAFQCWSNSDGTFDAKVGWRRERRPCPA